MAEASFRIGIAAESANDAREIAYLVDLLIEADVDWTRGLLDDYRRWSGLSHASAYFDLHTWNDELRRRGLRLNGDFARGPDARMIRGLILLFSRPEAGMAPPDAVVICRDTDGVAERAEVARQVRDQHTNGSPPVALALPHPEHEAWLISGFHAESDEDRARLEQLRRTLGADPTTSSHTLRSTSDSSPKDCKAVLATLTAARTPEAVAERRAACVRYLVGHAASASEPNGLATFMQEVRAHIVGLLAPPRPTSAPP